MEIVKSRYGLERSIERIDIGRVRVMGESQFIRKSTNKHGDVSLFDFDTYVQSCHLWAVSFILCFTGIQVHNVQRSSMSSSTKTYEPWKIGAPASWQRGGPWKTPKTDYSAGATHSLQRNPS